MFTVSATDCVYIACLFVFILTDADCDCCVVSVAGCCIMSAADCVHIAYCGQWLTMFTKPQANSIYTVVGVAVE
jgi:hypothetical protein